MNLVPLPFFAILVACIVWLLPVAAAIWALVTLQQIRTGQQAIQDRLNTIEQLMKPR
jgi:hypothetical protein